MSHSIGILCSIALTILLSASTLLAQKPKLIVETDIGGDKDDQGTFCRLLLYSNDLDIKAIICDRPSSKMGTDTSRWYPAGADTTDGVTLAKSYIDRWATGRYEEHDPAYPTAAILRALTVPGWDSTSAGVDKIIAVVDTIPANEIIWYGNWGSNTGTVSNLKRALDKVKAQRGQAGLESFISKIRICTLDGDSNSRQGYNAEIRSHSMHIETGYPTISSVRWYHAFDDITATAGGFILANDITNGHGELGEWYPSQKEGDSWTIVHLLPLGISDPAKPSWGGAAGRYGARTGGDASVQGAPFYWNNQEDTYNGTTNRNNTAARFAAALQNDFRARWDWHEMDPAAANHPPAARLTMDGSTVTNEVKEITVAPGATLSPSSADSTDSDSGDVLTSTWTYYREAGTYSGSLTITGSNTETPSIVIPANAAGKTLHIYVQVSDNGSRKGNRIPNLSRFCRLVVNVSSTGAQAFQESGGQVVMEAERFSGNTLNTDPNGEAWRVSTAIPGYLSSGYVATPIPSGTNLNADWANGAKLSYAIEFQTSGIYNVWFRRYSQSAADNSGFAGMDGVIVSGYDNIASNYNAWTWKKLGTITVSTGLHHFQICRREAGYRVDKIVLTISSTTPSGTGPVESPLE